MKVWPGGGGWVAAVNGQGRRGRLLETGEGGVLSALLSGGAWCAFCGQARASSAGDESSEGMEARMCVCVCVCVCARVAKTRAGRALALRRPDAVAPQRRPAGGERFEQAERRSAGSAEEERGERESTTGREMRRHPSP